MRIEADEGQRRERRVEMDKSGVRSAKREAGSWVLNQMWVS